MPPEMGLGAIAVKTHGWMTDSRTAQFVDDAPNSHALAFRRMLWFAQV
jgi:hypothetical protein